MIFNDPSHKEWTVWDYKLYKAYFMKEDWYRDGIPVWWDESDRVAFDAEPRISKSRAAIEKAQEKASKAKTQTHGRYYIAKPRVIGGGELPTRDEWIQEQEIKSGRRKISPTSNRNTEGPTILQGRK
jgi:hypothetical protein